jgi:hypothetical protein
MTSRGLLKTSGHLAFYGLALWIGGAFGVLDLVPKSDMAVHAGGLAVFDLTLIVGLVSVLLPVSRRTRPAGEVGVTFVLMLWLGYVFVAAIADVAVEYLRAHPEYQRLL